MQVEMMEDVLVKLNQKVIHQEGDVILIMDNAAVQPISLKEKNSNIKIVFLPKNNTPRLQPLSARIIKSFKVKFEKKLMRFALVRKTDNRSVSEIASTVDILQTIQSDD